MSCKVCTLRQGSVTVIRCIQWRHFDGAQWPLFQINFFRWLSLSKPFFIKILSIDSATNSTDGTSTGLSDRHSKLILFGGWACQSISHIPLTTHYSLLTTHYSLFTIHYSLLTIHYSLFTTHYSLFSSHYSLFTILYSLFSIHYSLLTIHYSLFTILYSLFSILYSLFTLLYN